MTERSRPSAKAEATPPESSRRRRRLPRIPRRWKVAIVLVAHLLGLLSSVEAIMSTRTPQGAIAWAISLNTFPYVAVPAYWVFGRSKFDGYELLRRSEMLAESEVAEETLRILKDDGFLLEPETESLRRQQNLLENIAKAPFTRYNAADLLIDGEQTFDAILNRISEAQDYVLVQFYILRADGLGNRLKDALIERASAGVRVYLIYDGLGSKDLPEAYVAELEAAGAEVASFATTRGWGNRFRLNFRNHRKIVVVDGKEAFVGGHNVGDEYLGEDPVLTPWRDTHVAVRGPVVLEAQLSFVEDWRWATGDIPELQWTPEKAEDGDVVALCLPTGPADEFESGTLLMLDLINIAQDRIWIASPYFVPDAQFVSALQLAALRGVDVRVLIPENNDDQLVNLTSYSYLQELEESGIGFYRFEPGFMHQKVILIDDQTAAIGTANFDNRSMRLNFEVTMLLVDEELAGEVEEMLLADFAKSRPFTSDEYTEGSFLFRLAVRTARLFAPVQ